MMRNSTILFLSIVIVMPLSAADLRMLHDQQLPSSSLQFDAQGKKMQPAGYLALAPAAAISKTSSKRSWYLPFFGPFRNFSKLH